MTKNIMTQTKQAIHGGDVERVSREYGIPVEDIIDFSANINPLPLPLGFKEALMESMEDIRRYPDREYRVLRETLARYTKYPVDWIMVGNGATELIYLAVRALAPRRILLPIPSFAEYERAVQEVQGEIEKYPLNPQENFRWDSQTLIKTLKKGYDMLFLCNPNNPTGNWVAREEVDKVLREAMKAGTFVVLDETFAEFGDGDREEILQDIRSFTNVVVVGALTKFFAIPGLRLGYCIAHPKLLGKMAARKEPWTVNSLASAAGVFLLNQQDFIEETRGWAQQERRFFYCCLRELEGIQVYSSQANFFLLKLLGEKWTSPTIKKELEKKGLMIRDASSFQGLDQRFIRIAIKDRKSNMKLLEAFKELGL